MDTHEITMNLNDMKSLTTEQFEQCRNKALQRVKSRIGDKPTRASFQLELGALWTVLDLIGLLVFGAALVISSVHIIQHMGRLASESYATFQQTAAGTVIGADLFISIHQWAVIPLAEGSMILFLVMFGMTDKNWRRWVYLSLALLAGAFVLLANWQSGIGLLESMLAPAFTIGIGLKLEDLIVQSIKRRDDISKRYLEALATWEVASQDASRHPDYVPLLRQEIWQKLVGLKSNTMYHDAPPALKAAATQREIHRDTWAYSADSVGVPLVEQVNLKPMSADFLATNPLPSSNGTRH